MSYYQDDAAEGVMELKLEAHDLKPEARPIRITWTKETELELKRFTEDIAKMTEQLKEMLDALIWQTKIDSVLKAADDREIAYRKRVDLFLKQMEKRDRRE